MCTRYPIINRVSELKVHIELTRFVQPEKIEIDANERAVNEKSQYCFFVCTTFDSFLNDFLIFDDVNLLVETVRKKDDEIGLCKTVAGFSWDWKTKQKNKPKDDMSCYDLLVQNGEYDILIENHKYIWNLTNESWVTRQDSHCTIGCIHTTQGYDMNYVGVIFGKEIDYDFNSNSIVIDLENYKDSKVKAGTDKETLKELIINTYTTILARGIKGCYVYAYNKNMQKYLKKFIIPANEVTLEEK